MNFRTKLIQGLIEINESIIFYPRLRKFYVSQLKGKSISVIDVGSNKGQSINFFLKLDPSAKIYGFEPNKKLFSMLSHKYEKLKNITLFNLGISSKTGRLVFHENVLDETSTFENLNPESKYLEKKAKILGVKKNELVVGSYEVNVTTLTAFLNENEHTYFDVLKIDVEGHEVEALKGLFTRKEKNYPIHYIQIESHQDDMYEHVSSNEIAILLGQNGFDEVVRIKHGFGDFHEIVYENQQRNKS